MAVDLQVSYDELLKRWGVDDGLMTQNPSNLNILEFADGLARWEDFAYYMDMSESVDNIKSDCQNRTDLQKKKMLKEWQRRRGSEATYKELIEICLRAKDTMLAETAIRLAKSQAQNRTVTEQLTTMSPLSQLTTLNIPKVEKTVATCTTLKELDQEFYELVNFVEDSLVKENVPLKTVSRRFRILPQSIRRQLETDKDYKETRRRILDSSSTKELFDNLTELKHWSFMMPDTLCHILQDVRIPAVQQKMEKYESKLRTFKRNTKLKAVTTASFPVPDYCIQLTMEVEGWEDKTIEEAEKAILNILRRASYNVPVGWKSVTPGSLVLTFILMESVELSKFKEGICKGTGVTNIQFEGDNVYSDAHKTLEVKKVF